jgi:hypothetical protein
VEISHRHSDIYACSRKLSKIVEDSGENHSHDSHISENCPICNITANKISFVQKQEISFFKIIFFNLQNENTFPFVFHDSNLIPPRSPPKNLF